MFTRGLRLWLREGPCLARSTTAAPGRGDIAAAAVSTSGQPPFSFADAPKREKPHNYRDNSGGSHQRDGQGGGYTQRGRPGGRGAGRGERGGGGGRGDARASSPQQRYSRSTGDEGDEDGGYYQAEEGEEPEGERRIGAQYGGGDGGRRREFDGRRPDYGDRRPDYGGRRPDYEDRRPDYEDRRTDYPERPSKATLREQLEGVVLYGVAPVLAALRVLRRQPHALFVQEGLTLKKRKDAPAVKEVLRLARELGLRVQPTSKHDLNMLTDSRPHQGLVLDCSPLDWRPLDELPSADKAAPRHAAAAVAAQRSGGSAVVAAHPVWLALDEVTDPQNLGAMIRSAYCLGASGVLAGAKNCAALSATASKASAGAMEVMPLHSCAILQRTLEKAVASGWTVLGASTDASAAPLSSCTLEGPTVIVLGNEGHGLRANMRRTCTRMLRIDMGTSPRGALAGSELLPQYEVDSLNVSVATGIILHHFIAQATRKVDV